MSDLARTPTPPARMLGGGGGGGGRRSALRLTLAAAASVLMLSTALALTAQPAQAQTAIWSATLTIDADGVYLGCDNAVSSFDNCSTALTDNDFVYDGITYQVHSLYYASDSNRVFLDTRPSSLSRLVGLELYLGTTRVTLGAAPAGLHQWDNVNPQWTDNQQVAVTLGPVSLGRPGNMSTPGLYPMGPGRMKIAEGTSITYPIAIDQPPTADLIITPKHHNVRPDGSDYPEVDNSLLTIHNSVMFPAQSVLNTDWMNPKSVRLTAVDDSECKSPPGTRYWIRHHGGGGGPDWGAWDRQDVHHGLVISVEIIDDDCTYLARGTGQVQLEEGASATYTVRLKVPLEDAAYISPHVSAAGDSDPGAITVSPERIRVEAGDTSPQTFTVSARRDADSRAAVLHVAHSVDSPGIPADYLGARVTVVVSDEQDPARNQERDPLTVTGLALTAGSGTVALSPAFSTDVTSYRAEVPAGTTSVTLAPRWSGGQSVHAGSRQGATTFTRPARVRPSGTAADLALAPDGGATELYVMASGPGGMTTYSIHVTEARPEPKPVTAPDDDTPEQPQQQQQPQQPQPQQQTPEQQQPQPQQQQTADPVETPGPVVGLQLTAKGNKVIVTWKAPASGSTPDRYIAHIKNTDTGKGKNRKIAAGKTTTTFGKLTPGATYRVWVRAQNDTGKGQRIHARITLPTKAE